MKIYILFLLIIITSSEANSQTNKYENCCGDDAKVYNIQGMQIFVPNVITPNGDGINDEFYPIASNMKKENFTVANFQIFDEKMNLIFLIRGMDTENPKVWSFQGLASKRPHRPAEHQNYEYTGRFFYKLSLVVGDRRAKPQVAEVEGWACVVRCDEDAKIIKTKNKCAFPSQGVGGIYDKGKNNKETKCIE
jgi:CHU_C Type IX secretion signal domain